MKSANRRRYAELGAALDEALAPEVLVHPYCPTGAVLAVDVELVRQYLATLGIDGLVTSIDRAELPDVQRCAGATGVLRALQELPLDGGPVNIGPVSHPGVRPAPEAGGDIVMAGIDRVFPPSWKTSNSVEYVLPSTKRV